MVQLDVVTSTMRTEIAEPESQILEWNDALVSSDTIARIPESFIT